MFNLYYKRINRKYIIFGIACFIFLTTLVGCSDNIEPKQNVTLPSQEEHLEQKYNLSTDTVQENTDMLEVHFIDVGQADSILIKTPNKQNILIDAGNNANSDVVINYLKDNGIKKIDHVIGTHPHEDHIGGLDAVIETFAIGKVYMPKVAYTSKTYEDVLLAIKNKGLRITEAKVGVQLDVGSEVKAVLIAPNGSDYEEINNYSAVLKLTYGNNSFLFTGDAEEKSEFEMIAQSDFDLDVDVLKVGHHGSASSTSLQFLKAVSPKYAIISVGSDNDYGHPHKIIIERLLNEGVHYFRTDYQGTIIAYSDGTDISFNQRGLAAINKKKDIRIASDTSSTSKNSAQNSVVISKLTKPTPLEEIKIVNIDLKAELVTIKNTGDMIVNLSGWKLVSENGNQSFIFPNKTILQPGEIIKVVAGQKAEAKPGTLVWTKEYIWNNNGDQGALYDAQGNLIYKYKEIGDTNANNR